MKIINFIIGGDTVINIDIGKKNGKNDTHKNIEI